MTASDTPSGARTRAGNHREVAQRCDFSARDSLRCWEWRPRGQSEDTGHGCEDWDRSQGPHRGHGHCSAFEEPELAELGPPWPRVRFISFPSTGGYFSWETPVVIQGPVLPLSLTWLRVRSLSVRFLLAQPRSPGRWGGRPFLEITKAPLSLCLPLSQPQGPHPTSAALTHPDGSRIQVPTGSPPFVWGPHGVGSWGAWDEGALGIQWPSGHYSVGFQCVTCPQVRSQPLPCFMYVFGSSV